MNAQRRKRIAVLSFEVGAGELQTAEKLGAKDDLGLVLSNILVDKIVKAGKVDVVERSAIDKVLKEQNLSNSDRFDNTMAAKIGKIAGVDAILIGSVTQLAGSKKETTGSTIWKLARPTVRGREIGGERTMTEISIVMEARLIDVNTAVVLTSAEGSGKSSKAQIDTRVAAQNDQVGNPLLDDATLQAITALSTELNASPVLTATVDVARVAYNADVADVSDKTLILALGTKGGVRVGDVVQISRPGRVVKSKAGVVLKTIYEPLGTARVTEADDKSATVIFTGDKPVKVNDIARFTP
ncbi:CsgG/HfaB family protein [Edaphobacter paludis]|uniref:CsgG/HfaB family protein n=1 Tax=Edaphobacter paludis TaxID=3035702 RepID=A0AAU7D521_9BACT